MALQISRHLVAGEETGTYRVHGEDECLASFWFAVPTATRAMLNMYPSEDVAERNARQFVASRDVLVALRAFTIASNPGEFDMAMRLAEAAIAKAEGV